MNINRSLAIGVLFLGAVAIALGGVFIGQGISKNNFMVQAMRTEQITLGVPSEETAEGEVIDSAKEAKVAADTVREHRHGIAPTYGDLLAGGRFDATNPTQLTYAQAMNLENYLYLAVLGFGVTQVVMASGAFMVIMGIALGGTGLVLYRLSRQAV